MKKLKPLYLLFFVAGISLFSTACVTNQKTDDIYQKYAKDAKEDSADAADEGIKIAKEQLRNEALSLLTNLDKRFQDRQPLVRGDADAEFALTLEYAKERDRIKSELFAKAEKYSIWVNKIRNTGRAVEGLAAMQATANNAQRNIIFGFFKEDLSTVASEINYDLSKINPTLLALLSELFGEQTFVPVAAGGVSE